MPFFVTLAALLPCFQNCFADIYSRNSESKTAKKRTVLQWDFLDFGRQKSCFLDILEARGDKMGVLGDGGCCFEDFWDFCDFGKLTGTKKSPKMTPILLWFPIFWVLCFPCFFECSLFSLFLDFGCLEAPFWAHFCSILGGLDFCKMSEKCTSVVDFRGLTPSGRGLFAGLDFGCALMTDFCCFFGCLLFCGSHFGTFGHHFWQRNGPLKFDAKSVLKRSCGSCEWGSAGPLKAMKRTANKVPQPRPCVPRARWRIIN